MCISVIARVIKWRKEYVYFSDCESGCVVFCEFLCCMTLVSVVVDDTTTHAKPSTTAPSSKLVYHFQKTKNNTVKPHYSGHSIRRPPLYKSHVCVNQ